MNKTLIDELAKFENLFGVFFEFLIEYSVQLVGAVIVFVAGLLVAKWAAGFAMKVCHKKELDITLTTFISNVVKIIILIFVIIMSLGQIGVQITPFIAAVGAITFGAGLAVQALLSNYAAGIVIILTRPFIIGNTITVQGVSGIVHKVKLATTILTTEDKEHITIPNRLIVGEILHNSYKYRIVESVVGIDYTGDPEMAIETISATLKTFKEIPEKPKFQVGIDKFADSSINIGLRYWLPMKVYHQTRYKVNLEIYKALKLANITIPFPQRDVHLVEKK